MSRPLRIEYLGAWYHVMNRGRRSESIFSDKHDYLMFIDLLIEISEMWNVNVAAYGRDRGRSFRAFLTRKDLSGTFYTPYVKKFIIVVISVVNKRIISSLRLSGIP